LPGLISSRRQLQSSGEPFTTISGPRGCTLTVCYFWICFGPVVIFRRYLGLHTKSWWIRFIGCNIYVRAIRVRSGTDWASSAISAPWRY
jgi:hypothetical protein